MTMVVHNIAEKELPDLSFLGVKNRYNCNRIIIHNNTRSISLLGLNLVILVYPSIDPVYQITSFPKSVVTVQRKPM